MVFEAKVLVQVVGKSVSLLLQAVATCTEGSRKKAIEEVVLVISKEDLTVYAAVFFFLEVGTKGVLS